METASPVFQRAIRLRLRSIVQGRARSAKPRVPVHALRRVSSPAPSPPLRCLRRLRQIARSGFHPSAPSGGSQEIPGVPVSIIRAMVATERKGAPSTRQSLRGARRLAASAGELPPPHRSVRLGRGGEKLRAGKPVERRSETPDEQRGQKKISAARGRASRQAGTACRQKAPAAPANRPVGLRAGLCPRLPPPPVPLAGSMAQRKRPGGRQHGSHQNTC